MHWGEGGRNKQFTGEATKLKLESFRIGATLFHGNKTKREGTTLSSPSCGRHTCVSHAAPQNKEK